MQKINPVCLALVAMVIATKAHCVAAESPNVVIVISDDQGSVEVSARRPTFGTPPCCGDETPPNVVLIFADDLGYGDLGCYGATKVQTPNIDRLAAEGRRFTDAHSVSAACTPSRYALLTGQYPFRENGGKGVWGPAPVTSPLIVDTDKKTIADVFKGSGYDTAALGKWHLGFGEGKNDWQELSSLLESYAPPQTKQRPGKESRPSAGNPAKKSEAKPSERSASFDFEPGNLEPWKVIEGKFGHLLGSRSTFFRDLGEYNKQGAYYLTTLESSADALRGMDSQTGVIVSPLFIPDGGPMTFRVGGGRGQSTYVALCTVDGKEILFARGINNQVMQKAEWDLTPYAGKKLFLKVVDTSTDSRGHITVDDFQFDGKVLEEFPGVPKAPSKDAYDGLPAEKQTTVSPQPEEAANTSSATSLPNFVIIFADDLGYGDISCYSPRGVETPHLDALADDGFRSTDFFIPANVCSPSRAALLTGRYPMRCGLPVARNENVAKYKDYGLASEELTIPELLRPAGYRSLMVGKWHLGLEVEGSHPLDAGFNEHLGIPSNYEPKRGKHHDTLYRGKQIEQQKVRCQELTRRYTDEVVDFIGRQEDNPFFIYVSHHIVHSPLLPSKDFVGTSMKGKYGDFIKELDHSTGRIMKAIRDAGLDDNTLVVFTSDNGPTRAGSTGGLAGGKYCTMEGGHRVPGIFRWPGKIPAGQVSGTTLTSMDLLPLFCSLAGVDQPTDRKIDGENILPILQGKETSTPHEVLYYYNGTNLQAVREGNWKLHLPRTPRDQPFWSKEASHKWRGFVKLDEFQLFDLSNDLSEKSNVADRYTDIVARLRTHAAEIRTELGDVRTTGTDQREINLMDPQER